MISNSDIDGTVSFFILTIKNNELVSFTNYGKVNCENTSSINPKSLNWYGNVVSVGIGTNKIRLFTNNNKNASFFGSNEFSQHGWDICLKPDFAFTISTFVNGLDRKHFLKNVKIVNKVTDEISYIDISFESIFKHISNDQWGKKFSENGLSPDGTILISSTVFYLIPEKVETLLKSIVGNDYVPVLDTSNLNLNFSVDYQVYKMTDKDWEPSLSFKYLYESDNNIYSPDTVCSNSSFTFSGKRLAIYKGYFKFDIWDWDGTLIRTEKEFDIIPSIDEASSEFVSQVYFSDEKGLKLSASTSNVESSVIEKRPDFNHINGKVYNNKTTREPFQKDEPSKEDTGLNTCW